jgi:hypothetical protein
MNVMTAAGAKSHRVTQCLRDDPRWTISLRDAMEVSERSKVREALTSSADQGRAASGAAHDTRRPRCRSICWTTSTRPGSWPEAVHDRPTPGAHRHRGDDLAAATAFFAALGLEPEDEASSRASWWTASTGSRGCARTSRFCEPRMATPRSSWPGTARPHTRARKGQRRPTRRASATSTSSSRLRGGLATRPLRRTVMNDAGRPRAATSRALGGYWGAPVRRSQDSGTPDRACRATRTT